MQVRSVCFQAIEGTSLKALWHGEELFSGHNRLMQRRDDLQLLHVKLWTEVIA